MLLGTPPNLNDQHRWGGERFRPPSSESSTDPTSRTFVGRGRQNPLPQSLSESQGGFIASSSDDLFHPNTNNVPLSHRYTLPNVSNLPLHPDPRYAYTQPPIGSSRPLPYPSSSYHNPSFEIPPPHHHPLYNNGPAPPVPPPTFVPQPAHDTFYHQPFQSGYTQPFPRPPSRPSFPSVLFPTHPPAPPAPPPPPSRSTSRASRASRHSSPSPSRSKTLPSVTHIPILTSKHDFFAWDDAVNALIHANDLIGHILEPLTPLDPTRPDLAPTPLPVLPLSPTASDISALNRWWSKDKLVQHILVARLGSVPRGLLPSPNLATRTALSIYRLLLHYYGTCSFADCTELLSTLHNSTCTTGRVQEFVSKWRTGLARLQSAHFVFNIKLCIGYFVRGLPPIPAFNTLRADLPDRIAGIAYEQDYGAFISLTERVLELDTIFRSALPSQVPRSSRVVPTPAVPPVASSLPTPLPSAPDPPSRTTKPPQSVLTCNNCKSRGLRCTGHTDLTCFQQGGGMEGRREEYLSNKGRMHAMIASCLENALLSDSSLPSDSLSPSNSPLISPVVDDDIPLPPIANLCVTSFAPNSDLYNEDAYLRCESKFLSPFAFASGFDFGSAAFIALGNTYNAVLDSGCTHHIIRDRALFRNYGERALSVGTANCGSLEALGTGDVEFRYTLGDRTVTFTLHGCLYAPSAPINLLSVGALAERGLCSLFSPGGFTKIFYPDDHPRLPGFYLSASVVNRLSFLNLSFIPLAVSLVSTALPLPPPVPSRPSPYSFPRVPQDSMLWHRRFGHIGMEATRAALTKDYVTGIQLEGSFVRDHCIPCLVGKSPQRSYSFHGNRAAKIGELLHMDLCGPFPVQGPRGEKYFFNILDDKSNWGFTFGLRLKSDAFVHYLKTEAFLVRSNAALVLAVRCGGELELTAGQMGDHFASKGIVLQRTVAYAHQQNGKSERYIRTIEEGGQALLADSGLPMSFWIDAVLTHQYLVNRLPTSTLPSSTTPFEIIMSGRKPDLSHLRVWGCDCYVAVPDELRGKAGPKRFRAIFVGYEEHRIGWRVRDLAGKYSFSNDVVFNENLSARLGVPRPLLSAPPVAVLPVSSSSHHVRDRPRIRTAAGQLYDDLLAHKRTHNEERQRLRSSPLVAVGHGGATVETVASSAVAVVRGGVSVADVFYGGVDVDVVDSLGVLSGSSGGASDLSPSIDALESFISFLASSSFPNPVSTVSLVDVESDVVGSFLSSSNFLAFKASPSFFSRSFDLSKPPLSYTEAIARQDSSIWHAAMDRERQSLSDMGAFEETVLPQGEKTIGLKWVYDIKTDAAGVRIPGKEKARLVAQGFNQRPGQYDETYAPVAKMASVRVLLAWAAVQDLDIFQSDCKTAFLHAKIRHPLYVRPFPGYPTSTPGLVLRVLVALYGLRQAAYEFYMLILSLLLDLGMVRCEVDHGIFFGEWTSSPAPSVPMPPDGSPLVLFVPLHVDDGLAITNSPLLYAWFLSILSRRLHIVDLGPCAKFLNILIIRDRPKRRLWLSSHVYIAELLSEWNLSTCRPVSTPFPSTLPDPLSAPPNSLPALSDADLLTHYQRLVGCLLYIAITTRPDLSYYAMWLGQFNASPTRAHFLLTKHVLRYLAGTSTLALCLGAPSPRVPSSLSGYLQNMGCTDADWASDVVDRKSISGYSFYFQGSLVSWSAVKQKSIALSSTEAEYYAMAHAFKEALWLRTFLGLLRLPVPRPFPILCDNQAACSLSNSPAISARSKHIDIRHHFLRDHVQAGSFSTTWVPTEDMPADIFTKPLPLVHFSRHRDVLGLSVPSF